MNNRGFVLIDADNTLWDTNAVFAEAQLKLFEAVRAESQASEISDPLSFVRSIDQAIAERHHDGLRYPPRLLARALGEAFRGIHVATAARRSLGSGVGRQQDFEREVEAVFLSDLRRVPELRRGVREGLGELRYRSIPVVILSESSREKVMATAQALGIDGLIEKTFEGKKRKRLFARFARLAGPGNEPFVIGDQLDRDIAPASAAEATRTQ